jgi:hypothetical protein
MDFPTLGASQSGDGALVQGWSSEYVQGFDENHLQREGVGLPSAVCVNFDHP